MEEERINSPVELLPKPVSPSAVTTTIILMLLLFVCVVVLGVVIYKLTTDGAICMKDPIIYYNSLGPDQCFCGSQNLVEVQFGSG